MPSADVSALTDLSHVLLNAIRSRDRKSLDAILTSDFVHVNEAGTRTARVGLGPLDALVAKTSG